MTAKTPKMGYMLEKKTALKKPELKYMAKMAMETKVKPKKKK